MTDSQEQLKKLSPEQRALLLSRLKKQKQQAEKKEEYALSRQSRDSSEFPLSFEQQGIWFLEQFEEASLDYNVATAFALAGQLDITAFEKSLNDLVKRHEILRTTFQVKDGQPIQVVSSEQVIPLAKIDLTHLPRNEQAEKVRQLAEEEDNSPFDLSAGPLIRVSLLQLEDENHVLFLTMHHIVFDGWSKSIIYSELSELYGANADSADARLPDLEIQYADFSCWQARFLESETCANQLDYWKQRLRGAPDEIGLPTDKPRANLGRLHAKAEGFGISPDSTKRIKLLAGREATTSFTVLFSVYALLLSRYSGHQDIVIGVPIANRNRKELERLIGIFVNTVAVRVDLSGNINFLQLLERTKQAVQEGFDNSDIPFQKLVEEIQPERNSGYMPIFQVTFNLLNAPGNDFTLKGLSVSHLILRNVAAGNIYDLTFTMEENGDRIKGIPEYNAALFDPATIDRMAGSFQVLLEGCLANPVLPLESMPMLTTSERDRILVKWNDTDVAYDRDRCVHESFEYQAATRPDAVAVDHGGKTLSYQQLNERANRLAHFLRVRGVGPEVMVGVYMERSLEMIVGLLGILKAGGAYVPLDMEYPQARIAYMLEDTGVPVLLSLSGHGEQLSEFGAELVCLDSDWANIERESADNPVHGATADNLAYVIFTSGSTGTPKGVEVQHGGLSNLVNWHIHAFDVGPADRATHLAGLGFDASVWELWPYLVSGASVYLVSDERRLAPGSLWSWMAARGITLSFLPTPLAEAALREPIPGDLELRVLLTGGDRLHGGLVKNPVPFRVVNNYGPTENSVVTTSTEIDVCAPQDPPIGRPIDNVQIYILDKGLQPVPVGVWGELYIGGGSLARGYLNQPELTAEKFVPNPFSDEPGTRLYRSGDLVRYRKDGQIEFGGRFDHQVKVRGLRIELGEIESVLARHEAVRDAVVLLREDQPGDKRLVAYVLARENAAPTVSELREFMRERLASYMLPSAFMVLDSLPLTPNGKLDRDALPSPDMAYTAEAEYIAPSGELETHIAAIWRDLLGLEKVGVRDNFFDLGGHSLLLSQVQARLTEKYERKIAMIDFFHYPTIESLSRHLGGESEQSSAVERERARRGEANVSTSFDHEDAIAIIGMAGRFPGAATVEDYWDNLAGGVESIRFFSDEELRAAGISEALIADPRYVAAKGYLDDADLFDAAFFGFPPREAELIDPQQRIFLECAWEALERAGYDPARFPGLIGVYAGSTTNRYSQSLFSHPEIVHASGSLQITISSDKDFLPTRTSYKLNLRGPSVNVQTACSTSLVAIHEACRSLRERECDMALAGGISVLSSRVGGYMYQDESILSPDGHCKAFSSDARGTVSGEGVGILVLKRLSEAKQDGDSIQAVIRGTAINNDGSNKIGYTAPSVEGQADVIAMAQANARVSADSIDYIETHGTGTMLGDPIEITALSQVFGDNRDVRGSRCAIGAVKTNIGHLDAAAGVAGVIKTALSLKHGQIPPSLNCREPNPEIDFESTPFYVNTELRRWETAGDKPRRAGVSSFGIGGTNAHAVLEQAPPRTASEPGREWQVLPISARNEAAMEQYLRRIADHLERNPDVSLADVSYTLRTGRGQFEYRAAAIGADSASAAAALRGQQAGRLWSNYEEAGKSSVIFMFPGQGSQHVGMGQGLYETETVFREIVDHCCARLQRLIDIDLRDVIFNPSADDIEELDAQLRQTLQAQCSLFIIEYALARLWMSWGIQPAAMIGHSIGEYVAACVAGAIDLDAALSLIASRGQAMAQAPAGSMLSVPLSESQIARYLNDDLWLSVINARTVSVVSGALEAIDDLEQRLQSDGIEPLRLKTAGAFHSGLMDAVVPQLVHAAEKLSISPASIPYISNVTGTWIEADQLEDPQYWGQHLRSTVRFSEGVDVLLEKFSQGVFLEVGPGKTLASLLRQAVAEADTDAGILSSLRHPREQLSDAETVAGALAGLWLRGVNIDWQGYDEHSRRCRVELPTYPFQRQNYWVDLASEAVVDSVPASRQAMERWFYIPSWKRSMPRKIPASGATKACWLLLCDDAGTSAAIDEWLREQECETACVFAGNGFTRHENGDYTIDPGNAEDYRLLVESLQQMSRLPDHVVHSWSVSTANSDTQCSNSGHDPLVMSYHSLVYLTRALGGSGSSDIVDISIISNCAHAILKDDLLCPDKAVLLGPCGVIGQEFATLSCRNIDIDLSQMEHDAETLMAEILHPTDDMVVAYREGRRWIKTYEAVKLDAANREELPIKPGGVYLITGGLGGIGLALANYLAREYQASLVLTSRSELPPREQWSELLAQDNSSSNPIVKRINDIQALEEQGARVLVLRADVAESQRMQEVLDLARQAFGAINGVIHAAGLPGGRVIQLQSAEIAAEVLRPKVDGTRVLGEILEPLELDFFVLCSSLASVLGVAGLVDYCSANAFQDAWADYYAAKSGIPVISINWDTWNESGMAVNLLQEMGGDISELAGKGLNNDEGIEVFERILAGVTVPQVAVSISELSVRMSRHVSKISAEADVGLEAEIIETSPRIAKQYERPELSCPFEEAGTPSQILLTKIWKQLFKFDRIGIRDDFFELGGDSLLAIRVIAEIREKFDTSLSIDKLFELGTIDKLASHMEAMKLVKFDAEEKTVGDETRKEFEI